MQKMKELQPQLMRLKEMYKNDKVKLNQEMMALYKREKVNPAAGCLPILIQIPVFFALYKILFVSLEMRHAPFYLWINDLSVADPTSILNLFGLLPYDPNFLPKIINIGIWPLLMGGTMWLQQKLNPQPTDPIQAKIFTFLPIFFTFVLAPFPSGLVIYWTANNVLSMGQQILIKKKMEKKKN
jgi:YidC/Oxa1 family membrane protein insertase